MTLTLILIFAGAIFLLLIFNEFVNRRYYSYWKRLGIDSLPAIFPVGNAAQLVLQRTGLNGMMKEWHSNCKGRFVGVYVITGPVLVVKDLDLIRHILVKDFAHFTDRGIYTDEEREPTSAHLFRMSGQKWRDMRTKLTPLFTTGKLKVVFKSITDVADRLRTHLHRTVEDSADFNLEDLTTRYNADVIASSTFGLETDSFNNPTNEFVLMALNIFVSKSFLRIFRAALQLFSPALIRLFRTSTVKEDTNEFVTRMVYDVIDYREKNKVVRMDLMQMLIQLKNQGRVYDDHDQKNVSAFENDGSVKNGGITINELIAQAYTFFFAGFETASTTMSFLLYHCALDHSIQDRIRDEIDEVLAKHDGELTYESISEMHFLERCILETLRMYPVLPYLNRCVTQDYTIPGTKITLKTGTRCMISVSGVHYDPEIYANPDRFEPDRFLVENLKKRHPLAYLPFGEGPRNCIGKRMGKMMIAVGVATILQHYYIEACDKTDIPLEFNKLSYFVKALNPIQLKFVKSG